jgi:hypothetical protein
LSSARKAFLLCVVPGFLSFIAPLILGPPLAEAKPPESIISSELAQTRDLFEELLRAAGVSEPIPLVFLKDFSAVNGFFAGGCYEELHVYGKDLEAYQSPAIYLSYGSLWVDKGSQFPTTAGYIIAHELSHFLRALHSRDLSCASGRQRTNEELKHEELEADRGAVRLLTKIGLDGAKLAEAGLRTLCERNPMACPREAPDHPPLIERLDAMRYANIEGLLQEISFPVYAKEDGPFVGTAFNFKPTHNHVFKVVATAGHVWADIFRYRQKANRPQEDGEYCDAAGRCVKLRARDDFGMEELIAYSEKDPIDFAYLWEVSEGEQKTRYAPIASTEPKIGDTLFSLGMDEKDGRGLAILEYLGEKDGYLFLKYVGGCFMKSGTSGSPIVNASGEIVGISVRSSEEKKIVRGTNIRIIAGLAAMF